MPSFQIRIDHNPYCYLIPEPYFDWIARNALSYDRIARTSTGSNHRGWDHYTIGVTDASLASVFKILFPEVVVEAVFE